MNVAKLRKLKKWILAEPRRYNQGFWLFGKGSYVVEMQKPPCGTVGCLAGNACLMEGFKPAESPAYQLFTVRKQDGKIFKVKSSARKILGLTSKQASGLFDQDCAGWPAEAANLYNCSGKLDVETRAKAAAMAIDALIETGRQGRKPPKHRKAAH